MKWLLLVGVLLSGDGVDIERIPVETMAECKNLERQINQADAEAGARFEKSLRSWWGRRAKLKAWCFRVGPESQK